MKKLFLLPVVILSVIYFSQHSTAQTIRINEVFSRGVPGNLDWVEVYNLSASTVDISGYKIYDGGGKWGGKAKKLFPTGTVLAPKGFTVVITDTASFVGDLSGFGLSSTADTIWVETGAGVMVDSVAIPALGADTSYARIPDGASTFVKNSPVTRGASNVVIKINEAFSRGVPGNLDWVEMYNSATKSIDISGYKIYDGGGKWGGKAKKLFPAGTVLESKGFAVIATDTASFVGDLSGFGLSTAADTVWVENLSGVVIDSVSLPALGADTSYARVPDGSGAFKKSTPPTKGKTNGPASSVKQVSTVAGGYALDQNFPNPFNPSTTIRFSLPITQMVTVTVYDILGKKVSVLLNEVRAAGMHAVAFDAHALSSGMYFYQFRAGNFSEIKKMIVVK